MLRVTQVPLIDRLLVLGPPGIGKTEVILEKSRERAGRLGRVFVDLRTADDCLLDKIFNIRRSIMFIIGLLLHTCFPRMLTYL